MLGHFQNPNSEKKLKGEARHVETRREVYKQSNLLAAVHHLQFIKGIHSSIISPSLQITENQAAIGERRKS